MNAHSIVPYISLFLFFIPKNIVLDTVLVGLGRKLLKLLEITRFSSIAALKLSGGSRAGPRWQPTPPPPLSVQKI